MPVTSDPRPDGDVAAPGDRSGTRRKRRSWARRRHLGLITTALALVVLVAGVLLVVASWNSGRTPVSQQAAALGGGTTTAPASSPPAGSSAAPTVSSAPGPITVRVTITGIGGDNRWTTTKDSGLPYDVVVTAATTFVKNRTFSSYAVGDVISVEGTLDAGVITAAAITGKPSSG